MLNRGFLLISVLGAAIGRAEPTLLDRGYAAMYNLQFAEAHRTFQEWQGRHPADPIGPVSDAAAFLFSEFDRLHILQSEFFTHDQHFVTDHRLTPDPALKQSFQAALKSSRALAARDPDATDSLFAVILCNGLESDYAALIDKRYGASLQQMKAGRAMAERLLARDPSYYDAWIAIGVENYMLSIKPAPVRWLLRLGGAQTSRELGMEKLRLTAEKGRYLAPFARLLLAVAAMRDQDTGRARALLTGLIRDYPYNRLYRDELARMEPIAFRSEPR